MAEERAARRLSRKERERLAHRREILEAAERVFARNGYHGATVEQIAQEAEFAVGTLYNFFESKEHLYTEVVRKLADELLTLLERRVLRRRDPLEALRALVDLRLRHFEEHRGFARAFFESMPGSRLDPARAVPELGTALYDQYMGSVSGIFARGIQEGVFEPHDPLYLTLCLEGIINASIAYWTRREPAEPLTSRIEELQGLILSRMTARRAPEEPCATPREEGRR